MSVLAKLQSDRYANKCGHPSDGLQQHIGQIGRQPPMGIMGYRKNISELGLSKGGGVCSPFSVFRFLNIAVDQFRWGGSRPQTPGLMKNACPEAKLKRSLSETARHLENFDFGSNDPR
jgi:hypothetical protein